MRDRRLGPSTAPSTCPGRSSSDRSRRLTPSNRLRRWKSSCVARSGRARMPRRTQNQGGLEAASKRGQQLARILLLQEVLQKENSHVECSTNDRVGRVACAWRESVRSFGSGCCEGEVRRSCARRLRRWIRMGGGL